LKNWTFEQQQAIFSRGKPLLVSAAAGAGKTSVLVERVITRVLDDTPPVELDRLLVVTFTEKAAGEMKERLGAELLKRQTENPENLRILEQLELLPVADITTLHSFCFKIIRKYGRMFGFETRFNLLEGPGEAYLKDQVLTAILEKKYAAQNPEFFSLLEYLNEERSDYKLKSLILNLYNFSRSHPEPENWLVNSLALLQGKWERIEDTLWYQEIKENALFWFDYALNLLNRALEIARSYNQQKTAAVLLADIDKIQKQKAGLESGYEITKNYLGEKFDRFTWERGMTEGKEPVQKLRDKAKKIIDEVKKRYFSFDLQNFKENIATIASFLTTLVDLVLEFSQEYQKEKERLGFADFSDLEHWALTIIKMGVAKELSEKYEEILVDEYQDINGLQEELLQLLSRQGQNLFLVGDVKQSIYRFRLARPEIFLHKYETFQDEEKVELSLNFRSREEVIETVNFIFRKIMKKEVAELFYDDRASLKKGAQYPAKDDCFAELCLLEGKPDEERESLEAVEDLTTIEREARLVAAKILQLKNEGFRVYDSKKQEYRPVEFRDIVILARSLRSDTNVWQEELSRVGIPVYVEGAGSFLKAKEISLAASLLKVIDNPRQDIPLAAVLASPIADFTFDELWQVRLSWQEGSLYDALLAKSRDSDELGQKVLGFFKLLTRLQELSRKRNLPELLTEIYQSTSLLEIFGAYPQGAVRQANLKLLLDLAVEFSGLYGGGIYDFLNYLDIAAGADDFSPAKLIGEADDVVRVMSVHQSKGLEFPVVFVVGLGKRFNIDNFSSLYLHNDLGFGPRFFDPVTRVYGHTLASQIVAERIRRETLAEEMRILYVALTRAKEKLILVGTQKNLKKKITDWEALTNGSQDSLNDGLLAKAASFLDWLGPVVFGDEEKLPGCLKVECVWFSENSEGEEQKIPQELLAKLAVREPFTEEQEYTAQFLKAVEFNYPGLPIAAIPRKKTVSDLKGVLEEKEVFTWAGEEIELTDLPEYDAVFTGNVYHEFLQRLDFAGDLSKAGLKAFAEKLLAEKVFTRESLEVLDFGKIARIFTSPLGQRILAASEVYRELPFTLGVKAGDIYPEAAGFSEKLLLQGVIDLLALDDEGYFIVDWKTDRVSGEILNERLKEYKVQLNLYARAVEAITGKKVTGKYLYFINLEKEVQV